VNIDTSLFTHPKLIKLRSELGISLPEAIGHLYMLWNWCLANAKDGDISAFDSSDIADAAQWEGNPETFLHEMIKVGFIDKKCNGRVYIHDWCDYNGEQ
jgi:hypothetical protein